MATTSTGATTLYPLLKEVYGDTIVNMLNDGCVFWDALQNGEALEVEVDGRGLHWPVHVKRSGGVGAIAEDATEYSAGTQKHTRGKATAKTIAGRIQLTLQAIEVSKRSAAAFASALSSDMEDMTKELKQCLNRQLIGNKISTLVATGLLGTVDGALAPSATVNFDNGFAGQFYEGQRLHFGAVAGTSQATGTVKSITDYNTIVLDAAITIADDAYIWCGESGVTSYNLEMNGLAHIVDNAGSIFDIDPATWSRWTAYKSSASANRPLSSELLDSLFDAVDDRSGSRPDFLMGHSSIHREVKKLMEPDVRYVPLQFKGGYERELMTWNNGVKNCPVVRDRMCTLNALYALSMGELAIGKLRDFDWVDEGAGRMEKVSNKLNYEMSYAGMMELITRKRNAHGVLKNITVNTGLIGF